VRAPSYRSKGTYNPLTNQMFATACILCPANSDTLYKKATAESDCLCASGFYDADMSATVDCVECPVGTDCGSGSTLEELPLRKGFYRLSANTVDVRVCPDAQSNCSASFGRQECESSSGCVGGVGNLCAPGLGGPFCLLCSNRSAAGDERVYYRRATSDAVATCKACGDTTISTIIVVVSVVAGCLLLVTLLLYVRSRLSAKTIKRLSRMNASYTPWNKLKILLTFFQISTQVPIVYEVTFPVEVNAILESFSYLVSFGLHGIATTPLECMGLGGYVPRLLFWMAVPPVSIIIVLVAVALWARLNERCKCRAGMAASADAGREVTSTEDEQVPFHLINGHEETHRKSLFELSLPKVLGVLIILYPLVTRAAFEGFPCYEFDDGRAWLRADVGIECHNDEHSSAMLIAWTAVTIYPIGLWTLCLLLLFKASTSIVEEKQTSLSRAVAVLWVEYDTHCFWWELMELLRKFLLVGLFRVIKPGTILQTAIGAAFSATYLVRSCHALESTCGSHGAPSNCVCTDGPAAGQAVSERIRRISSHVIEFLSSHALFLQVTTSDPTRPTPRPSNPTPHTLLPPLLQCHLQVRRPHHLRRPAGQDEPRAAARLYGSAGAAYGSPRLERH
jgi:hypothetical protein